MKLDSKQSFYFQDLVQRTIDLHKQMEGYVLILEETGEAPKSFIKATETIEAIKAYLVTADSDSEIPEHSIHLQF
jgi:hypothetical protein